MTPTSNLKERRIVGCGLAVATALNTTFTVGCGVVRRIIGF
jgi:hypothetical protein